MTYRDQSIEWDEDYDRLHFIENDEEWWRMKLDDVRVIAELITIPSLVLDEWYIVFVDRRSDQYWLPFNGDYSDELDDLAHRRFQFELDLALGCRVEFTTRILWPVELREQALYTSHREPRPWWLKPLSLFDGGREVSQLAPYVLELTDVADQFASGRSQQIIHGYQGDPWW